MDIYPYINSRAIREHLKKLDYTFDPMLCAYLVWQSANHTLKEKHAAWQEIIDTMPDMPVPERMNCEGWDSLHQMLKSYMETENQLISWLEEEDGNSVYVYEILTPFSRYRFLGEEDLGRSDHHWHDGTMMSRSFRETFEQAMKRAREDGIRFRIQKRYLGEPRWERSINGEYDTEGNIIEVYPYGITDETEPERIREGVPLLTKEQSDLIGSSFDGFWYDIPIPFEKGDLVYDPHGQCSCSWSSAPFVLMGTVPWFRKEQEEKRGCIRDPRVGDYTDMRAYGYSFDSESGFLNDDFDAWYLNLEYYTEPLRGRERITGAISKLVKEEIDAWTLFRLWDLFRAEYEVQKNRELGLLKYDGLEYLLKGKYGDGKK